MPPLILYIALIMSAFSIFIISIQQVYIALFKKHQYFLINYRILISVCSLLLFLQIVILTIFDLNNDQNEYLIVRILRWFIIIIASYVCSVFAINAFNKSKVLAVSNDKIINIYKNIIKSLFGLNLVILSLCIFVAIITKSALLLNYYDIFFASLAIFVTLSVEFIIFKIRMTLQTLIQVQIRDVYLSKVLSVHINNNDNISNNNKAKLKEIEQLKKARKKIDIFMFLLFGVIIFQSISMHNHWDPVKMRSKLSINKSPFPNSYILINQQLFINCWLSALLAHVYINTSSNELGNDLDNDKQTNRTQEKVNIDNTQSLRLSHNKFPSPSVSDIDVAKNMSIDPNIKLEKNTSNYFIDIRKYPDHVGCHAQRLSKSQKKYRKKHWKFHHH